MKKLLCIISLVFLFCFTIACQDKAALAELEKVRNAARTEDQNVALVHQFFKALDAQDYSRFKGLFATGAVLHGTAPQEDVTADNSAQLLGPLYQALPDLSHSVEDIFAKGDRVAARVLIQATHKGVLMGIPPYGNKLRYYQFAIIQIGDGRIQEGWRVTDSLGMMTQLGMELKPIAAKKK
jgi:predicted ester cyclase